MKINYRAALNRAGWRQCFGSVIGDYWAHDFHAFILAGSPHSAFLALVSVHYI